MPILNLFKAKSRYGSNKIKIADTIRRLSK